MSSTIELTFLTGPKAGERFTVDAERVSIGRLSECDLELNQPNVSRQHAAIKRAGGRIFIVDNRSGNGTFVNGKRITRVELQDGDEVRIGDHTMRVEWRAVPAPAPIISELPTDERPTRRELISHFLIEDRTGPVRYLEFAGSSLTIGRGEKCKLVLDDEELSRLHATIRLRKDSFEIKDAGSANGTYLNGALVSEAELQPGDRLEMGRLELTAQIISGALHLTITKRPATKAVTEPPPHGSSSRPRSRALSSVPATPASKARQARPRPAVLGGLALALATALLLLFAGRTYAHPRQPTPRIDAVRSAVYSTTMHATFPQSPGDAILTNN
jgi:pSer/pThr/pTyr-binding forkhead associated (FHA) protein